MFSIWLASGPNIQFSWTDIRRKSSSCDQFYAVKCVFWWSWVLFFFFFCHQSAWPVLQTSTCHVQTSGGNPAAAESMGQQLERDVTRCCHPWCGTAVCPWGDQPTEVWPGSAQRWPGQVHVYSLSVYFSVCHFLSLRLSLYHNFTAVVIVYIACLSLLSRCGRILTYRVELVQGADSTFFLKSAGRGMSHQTLSKKSSHVRKRPLLSHTISSAHLPLQTNSYFYFLQLPRHRHLIFFFFFWYWSCTFIYNSVNMNWKKQEVCI